MIFQSGEVLSLVDPTCAILFDWVVVGKGAMFKRKIWIITVTIWVADGPLVAEEILKWVWTYGVMFSWKV